MEIKTTNVIDRWIEVCAGIAAGVCEVEVGLPQPQIVINERRNRTLAIRIALLEARLMAASRAESGAT